MDVPGGGHVRQFVTARRAPEPSDLQWQNVRASRNVIIKRRLISVAAYMLLLGIAFAVQLGLAIKSLEETMCQQRGNTNNEQCSVRARAACAAAALRYTEQRTPRTRAYSHGVAPCRGARDTHTHRLDS